MHWGEKLTARVSQAQFFEEDLGNGVNLTMVSIPGGSFCMGSPEIEDGRCNTESPQHWVTIAPLFIGKYPVTQAQWQAVAALPKVYCSLNPERSFFKGTNRPVEQVSWHEAVEFCRRLSLKTGRSYRLPSEAEWEYAARAGTTTPFHFGGTITPHLANYNGNYSYLSGRKGRGTNRQQTTDVGMFSANAFGLYDLHGLVWEFCADPWHRNYDLAPSDGRVWNYDNDNYYQILRGGSWNSNPRNCRSASRNCSNPGSRLYDIGFRVVCGEALAS